MKPEAGSQLVLLSFAIGMLFVSFSWFPIQAQAQVANNAVCTAQSGCLPTAPSPAFFDASVFHGNEPDFCAVIYNILNGSLLGTQGYPVNGSVIDARGLSSGNTNMACATGQSPWFENSVYINKPSTILLPSGIIQIPMTWVLPTGTTLVGEETTDPLLNSGGATLQTTIQATTSPVFVGAMLQFGDATPCGSSHVCSDISVEHLTLDGNNQTVTGILNQIRRTPLASIT